MTIATPRPEPAADGPGSVTSLQSVEQVGDEVVTLAGALHLGRFTATSLGGQRFELHRDGRAWSAAAGPDGPAEHLGHEGVRPDAAVPDRHGEPLDVGYVTDVLRRSECSVGDLVDALDMSQPAVSKHLRVLREVGAVDVRDRGRQRLYRLNGRALKPIHDWVKDYERSWSERFEQLDVVLEELKQKEEGDGSDE